MREKGFAPILIIILMAILIGGYLVYSGKINLNKSQPTSNQTTQSSATSKDESVNWKTYNSPDGLYTFKYPESSNWYFYQGASNLGGYIAGVVCRNNCSNDTVTQFEVAPVTYKSVDEFINTSSGRSDFTRFTFNGDEAVKAAYAGKTSQAGRSFISVFVVHKGRGYEIQISYGGLLNLSALNQFPKANPDLFPTFKFINSGNLAEDSPETVVNNFYQWYLSCLNDNVQQAVNKEGDNKIPAIPDGACRYTSSPYISQKLVSNFDKFEADFRKQCSNRSECSHGDLILCAQNAPRSISVDKAEISGKAANTVTHTFFDASGDNPIKVSLEQEGKNWQITNIECKKR